MNELRWLPRRFAWLGTQRIAYADLGEGPSVLLLHGLEENADAWQPLLKQLRAERGAGRVIAIDLLGFGFSASPLWRYDLALHCAAIYAVLRRLELERCYALVGHGIGGMIGLTLLSAGLLQSERLVLLNTPAHFATDYAEPSPAPPLTLQLRLQRQRVLAMIVAMRSGQTPQAWLARQVSAERSARELLERSNLQPWLQRLPKLPTLILQSHQSAHAPLSHAARLAAAIPHAHYALIEGEANPLIDYASQRIAHWLDLLRDNAPPTLR